MKGIMPSREAHDTSVQSGPYKLGLLMHMKHSILSPWPVPELTGAQWVEPLPQAGYKFAGDINQQHKTKQHAHDNSAWSLLDSPRKKLFTRLFF